MLDPSIIGIITRIHDNIYVRLSSISQLAQIKELKERRINYFIDYKVFPATSFTSLSYLIDLGVSDVYIADDLMYNLKTTKEITDSHGIRTRMVLNRIPCTMQSQLNQEKDPWFPPDSKDILDKYIDTAEFECGTPYNWHKFGVYYRAWFKNKTWHGDLQEIIPDLRVFIPNDALFDKELISYKVNCRKHCINKDSKCRRCENFVEIAKELNEKNIGINKTQGQSQ